MWEAPEARRRMRSDIVWQVLYLRAMDIASSLGWHICECCPILGGGVELPFEPANDVTQGGDVISQPDFKLHLRCTHIHVERT